MNDNTRSEIRELIRANREKLPGVLHEYWNRSAKDFVAGGIGQTCVAESLLTTAVIHLLVAKGPASTIQLLREVADLHDMHLSPEAMPRPQSRH